MHFIYYDMFVRGECWEGGGANIADEDFDFNDV